MRHFKSALIAAATVSAALTLTSCEEESDYVMSLTAEEQQEAMIGTWRLTRASYEDASFDENREEHLNNDMPTTMESMVITEDRITFSFSEEVDLYAMTLTGSSVEVAVAETGKSFTFTHSVSSVPGLDFRMLKNFVPNSQSTEVAPVRLDYNPDMSFIRFSLYTKDDVHATRIIMDARDAHYEFERQ